MKNEIQIAIIGSAATGKTAIAQASESALKSHGMPCVYEKVDGDKYDEDTLQKALGSIKEKTSFNIIEIQKAIKPN